MSCWVPRLQPYPAFSGTIQESPTIPVSWPSRLPLVQQMFAGVCEQKVVITIVNIDPDQNRTWHFKSLAEHGRDRSLAVVGDYMPRVAESRNGELWFISPDGISVIDPRHLPSDKLLPPGPHRAGHSRSQSVLGKYVGRCAIEAPPTPHRHELEIDYTALSLVAPDKVLFRYKLEGWDQDWRDAGTRRQAFYGDLPPRRYTFRVNARNNSGLWNEAGACQSGDDSAPRDVTHSLPEAARTSTC